MKLITSVEEARSWIESGFPEPATVMALDLASLDKAFANARLAGSAFLGCTVGETLLQEIHRQRAGLVTDLPALPPRLRPFAPRPYTVGDLYAGLSEDGFRMGTDARLRGIPVLHEC